MHETLFLPVLRAQRHQPVVFECRYKVLAPARDEIKVLLRGEPAIHQYETKLQGVLQASMDHLAHHFVFCFLTFMFDLAACNIALKWLLYQLKRHRNRPAVALIQHVEQVNSFDRVTAAIVIMLTNQIKSLSSVHAFSWIVSSKISAPWTSCTSRTIALTFRHKSLDV